VPVFLSFAINGTSEVSESTYLFAILSVITLAVTAVLAAFYERIFSKLSKTAGVVSLVTTILFFVLAFSAIIFGLTDPATVITPQSFVPDISPVMFGSLA